MGEPIHLVKDGETRTVYGQTYAAEQVALGWQRAEDALHARVFIADSVGPESDARTFDPPLQGEGFIVLESHANSPFTVASSGPVADGTVTRGDSVPSTLTTPRPRKPRRSKRGGL